MEHALGDHVRPLKPLLGGARRLRCAASRARRDLSSATCMLLHHRRIMATEAAAWHRERFREHRDDYGPCVASLIEDGLRTSFDDYRASKAHQQPLTTAMAAQFQHSIDVLLTPAATGPAPDATTTGDPCMNAPWSYTGLPTVSFPIGLSAYRLPPAMQLAGPHQLDWRLLDVAEGCERLLWPVG